MAEEQTSTPAEPSPSAPPVPLEQAPLAEYVQRRARGERPGPPSPPPDTPPDDQTPAPEPPDSEPPQPPGPETPEQTAAAKASRTRGELQNRLDKLNAQLGYERRQNEKLQRERDEYLARVAQQLPRAVPEQTAPPAPPELSPDGPNLEAFLNAGKTYEQWIDARIDFQAQRIEIGRAHV